MKTATILCLLLASLCVQAQTDSNKYRIVCGENGWEYYPSHQEFSDHIAYIVEQQEINDAKEFECIKFAKEIEDIEFQIEHLKGEIALRQMKRITLQGFKAIRHDAIISCHFVKAREMKLEIRKLENELNN